MDNTQNPVPSTVQPQAQEMSYGAKNAVVILLLVLFYPLGLIYMWILAKHWPLWLKITLSIVPALTVLSTLLAITLITVNPKRQFSSTNNTKRISDVNAILNIIFQYEVDHPGFAQSIPTTRVKVDSEHFGEVCTKFVPSYVAALPRDPLILDGTPVAEKDCATNWDTGYEVVRSGTKNTIRVFAPKAEGGKVIEVVKEVR